MSESEMQFHESRERGRRAAATLAGGVSTAFRRMERPVPLVIRDAAGAHVVDIDGNRYVDFVCGYGPVILGHADEGVSSAALAASHVQQVGAQHEGEFQLAELLCAHIPAFELARISLSGSEAVHATLRVARAATGRSLVVKFAGHYHGWFDTILTATSHMDWGPESAGQPEAALTDVAVLEWNDADGLEQFFAEHGSRIAALIMEAYPCNGGVIPPAPGFLELARSLTAAHGAVLVFDEVITGFRLALGGAQEILSVTPDLAVVAKAMGNGYPISAFGGRRDLMELVGDNRVLHAGTYNAGGASVAAAIATIQTLVAINPYKHLRALGSRLRDGLTEVAAAHGHRLVTQGPGPVFFAWFLAEGRIDTYSDHLRADAAAYARFAEALMYEGVRIIPAGRWYLNAAHTDADIDEALAAAGRAFTRLAAPASV
ncbi:MAG: glutamate-semialdehyde -aminomutase [Gaiellales bacterium]|jgi:glutamate-1-semialdehyde 2,1-aminomutase|nr:glutamate-semialdehyde -aminomutase [Gaiellales bacterium]